MDSSIKREYENEIASFLTPYKDTYLYYSCFSLFDWFVKKFPKIVSKDLCYFIILFKFIILEKKNYTIFLYKKRRVLFDNEFRKLCRKYIKIIFFYGKCKGYIRQFRIKNMKYISSTTHFSYIFFKQWWSIKYINDYDYDSEHCIDKLFFYKINYKKLANNYYLTKCVRNDHFIINYDNYIINELPYKLSCISREKFIDYIHILSNTYFINIDTVFLSVKLADFFVKGTNYDYSLDLARACITTAGKYYEDFYYEINYRSVENQIEWIIVKYFNFDFLKIEPKINKFLISLFKIKNNEILYGNSQRGFSRSILWVSYFINQKKLYDTNIYFTIFIFMTKFKIRRLLRFNKILKLSGMIFNLLKKNKHKKNKSKITFKIIFEKFIQKK